MTRNITLTAPGSALTTPFIVEQGEVAVTIIARTESGGREFLGRSASGKIRIGRSNTRPRFEYAVSGLGRLEDVTLLRYLLAVKQNTPDQQIVLEDRWARVDQIELAWNNRSLISGSTITVSGRQLSYFSTNVELFKNGGAAIQEAGGGLYTFDFFASET